MPLVKTLFKEKTIRDEKRLAFCRTLPCAGCGKPGPNDPHHESKDRGMGIKGGDDETLPLCFLCHERRHKAGPSVYRLWGVDPVKLIARINRAYALVKAQKKGAD